MENTVQNQSQVIDRNRIYTYFQDPGHGWIEVPVSYLKALKILDDISGFSYVSHDGTLAYLEEDCDATLFMFAMIDQGYFTSEEDARQHVTSDYREDIFIRRLPRYNF